MLPTFTSSTPVTGPSGQCALVWRRNAHQSRNKVLSSWSHDINEPLPLHQCLIQFEHTTTGLCSLSPASYRDKSSIFSYRLVQRDSRDPTESCSWKYVASQGKDGGLAWELLGLHGSQRHPERQICVRGLVRRHSGLYPSPSGALNWFPLVLECGESGSLPSRESLN